ncbi:monofunctional biosynthetic peptidoglycan transglycosylase [Joostella sp. CR20]|uniref:monofunctional biosynthetic peptidoglycan transglycosylase n=1 Tax=Joostella sp. CR20 TaxID=2804312 RepID=UPI00313C7A91
MRIIKFLLKVCCWFVAISIFWVLFYKWVPVPVTPLMVIRTYQQQKNDQPIIWEHQWVSIDKISSNLQLAVICSEDQKFEAHRGFDIEAIEKVIENSSKKKKIRGASTISQQTAKNVFLWPGRSWIRKGFEVYFTFLIETFWSKERILEVYLNSIEMGNGIYGAEAASNYWFHKSAAKLSKQEAAAIAAILPNPLKYKANPQTSYIASRKQWIMRQMNNYGSLNLQKK